MMRTLDPHGEKGEKQHVADPQGFGRHGFPAKLAGKEGEDRFAFQGGSDGDSNIKAEIQGTRLCDKLF
jgi:hypothetical protein